MTGLVLTSTLLDMTMRNGILKVPDSIKQKLVCVSIIRSTRQLFSAPPYVEEAFVSDSVKHFTVSSSTLGHSFSCFEIPLGFFILGLKLTHEV